MAPAVVGMGEALQDRKERYRDAPGWGEVCGSPFDRFLQLPDCVSMDRAERARKGWLCHVGKKNREWNC